MTDEYRRILLDGYPILATRHGDELVTRDGRSIGVDDAVHLAPVNPSKIICVHLNYISRVREFITRLPPAPTYFQKPLTALNTHKGAVVRPERCNWLNYEGEIAIVIGRTCRNIAPDQAGEFIVTVKNTGAVTLEITASVQFTQRPIGAAGTLLVGTIIEGRQGPIGPTGFPGPIGPPGSGGAGSPGMVWQGTWTNGNPYHTNDVVAFSLYGSIVSSFICRVANTASVGSNDPGTDAIITWNPVAIGGATGIGEQGPPGVILNAPVIAFTPFNGTLFTGADFVAGDDTPDGYLGTGLAASGTFADLSINEFSISSGTIAGSTIAFLYGNPKLYFKGHGTIRLPSVADGAQFNYNNAFIKVTIADNGTYFGAPVAETVISTGVASGSDVTVFGTFAGDTHAVSISALPSPLSDFVVTVIDPNPVKIQLNIFGAQNL